jgi:cytochrome b
MVRVWDPFVRLSHWAVALAFALAYLVEDEALGLHVWAGYLIAVLVVLRLLWGFVGPRHARFSDFLYGPKTILTYLVQLASFRAPRHLGHSPAGGAMAVALWIGLLAVIWSGLELYAVEEGRGPLAAAEASEDRPLLQLVSEKDDDDDDEVDDEDREDESAWEEIHEVLADLVVFFVVLHLGGVALASVAHRENLVRTMVTGLKREA